MNVCAERGHHFDGEFGSYVIMKGGFFNKKKCQKMMANCLE